MMAKLEAAPESVDDFAEELRAAEWDYVALGHYHVYREVEPNAYYSGSIDYTSFGAWVELRDEAEARETSSNATTCSR